MHGHGESEQAARLSVFPDDMTGVKVEGEHQSWLQDKSIQEKCSKSKRSSPQQQQQRHLGAVQMFPSPKSRATDCRRASVYLCAVPRLNGWGRCLCLFPLVTAAPPPAITTNYTADHTSVQYYVPAVFNIILSIQMFSFYIGVGMRIF